MANIDSELAYFRICLNQKYGELISAGLPIPVGAIRETVESGPFANLTDEDRELAIRELEHGFTVTQARGAAVTKDFRPWLQDKRSSHNSYYWPRLRRYYLEGNVLPSHVVATLDNVTDEILDFSGDPTEPSSGGRRGMVMGHVQSGKTTNYSALICKAADAGYKVIILLAGITNSLRAQTQERLDETFIGKKSVFGPVAPESLPIQMYATERRIPSYGTSRDRDFTRDAAGMFFSLAAHNEPIIFVTKKNKAPLERLRDWLIEQGGPDTLDLPCLLIDDEADNASINTIKDPKRTTAINGVIRQTLALFDRSAYVGYTATPFANIFIDPDSDEAMEADDLFPRHFIKALDPPTNYVGSARVFADDGDLKTSMVRVVDDFGDILPLAHKRTHPLEELPPTLLKAIRVFCLSRAIRVLRGQGKQHCSMMINVSRFNDIQERVLGLVYTYLTRLQNAVVVNANLPFGSVTDGDIHELRATYEEEYGDLGIGFKMLLPLLPDAVDSIKPLTVNMKGGALEYSRNREKGLHVIAIGGLALSRGLTLEGLTVSYILRNTAASDTLMQMARWFGYRPDYEDICRLYLPETSLDHYEYVDAAIEELRTEVKRMQLLNQTPEQFGLRVRQSPLAIRITAANKMRTASKLTLAQDYSGRHIEGYALVNDDAVNLKNMSVVGKFVKALGSPNPTATCQQSLVWRGVNGRNVFSLLRSFRFSEAHGDLGLITGDTSLLQDYVGDRLGSELREWDVALPQIQSGEPREVFGRTIRLRSRLSGTADGEVYRVNGMKNRVADPNDVQLAMADEELAAAAEEMAAENGRRGEGAYCAHRSRPLLIIHVFKAKTAKGTLKIADPVVSLSVALPTTGVAPSTRTYQVNKVYKKQLELFMSEQDDDEEILVNEYIDA
ncbi:Z1 domain-containing protein [Sphingomonas sp. F9_3S_D5_B_2]